MNFLVRVSVAFAILSLNGGSLLQNRNIHAIVARMELTTLGNRLYDFSRISRWGMRCRLARSTSKTAAIRHRQSADCRCVEGNSVQRAELQVSPGWAGWEAGGCSGTHDMTKLTFNFKPKNTKIPVSLFVEFIAYAKKENEIFKPINEYIDLLILDSGEACEEKIYDILVYVSDFLELKNLNTGYKISFGEAIYKSLDMILEEKVVVNDTIATLGLIQYYCVNNAKTKKFIDIFDDAITVDEMDVFEYHEKDGFKRLPVDIAFDFVEFCKKSDDYVNLVNEIFCLADVYGTNSIGLKDEYIKNNIVKYKFSLI